MLTKLAIWLTGADGPAERAGTLAILAVLLLVVGLFLNCWLDLSWTPLCPLLDE